MQLNRLIDILFRQDTNNIRFQWFRYCFVAVGAFAVDYGSYFLASYVIGIPYLIAAVIGFVLGCLPWMLRNRALAMLHFNGHSWSKKLI